MSRAKVIHPCLISYGTTYTVWINLRRNQIWEIVTAPSEAQPYYSLERHGVAISILEDDFKRRFLGVEE